MALKTREQTIPQATPTETEKKEPDKNVIRRSKDFTDLKNYAVRELAQLLTERAMRNSREIAEELLGDDEIDKSVDNGNVTQRLISITDQIQLRKEIRDEIYGYGPITDLINDETISEIMVNRADLVYIERSGHLIKTSITFDSDAHVRRIIDKIFSQIGRHVDESHPMEDGRLPNGSRVNAVIEPVSVNGSVLTIRKFKSDPLTIEDLINYGTLSVEMSEFLKAAVVGRLNILICGGTGSGKTTLLNVLSSFVPEGERIVTIEDAAELKLQQEHVVPMEAKPEGIDGSGAVDVRAMVRNSLRMRPDRIVVGEVRGEEALDMLQVMNTGHDGSMTTAHANSPRDAVSRIETMSLMTGMNLPDAAIKRQFASAFNLIIQQDKLIDGSRKITSISEVTGIVADVITMQELFRFVYPDANNNRDRGHFEGCGIIPGCLKKMEINGANVDMSWFEAGRSE